MFQDALFKNLLNSHRGELNVQDAAPFHINGFLRRDTCVSSTQQNRP
jgi:hypothetical protein